MSVAWFLPSQTISYLVAQSASEGRLFSHAQAQRFAFAYTTLVLIGWRSRFRTGGSWACSEPEADYGLGRICWSCNAATLCA